MKVLFIGPSLSGVEADYSGLEVRDPARQGDIALAVLDGATAIGLVDGYFDAVAAPWHKEILYALSSGVAMLGASSMGALRAAECAPFGMRPVGVIAGAYASGALDDDAAVALSHGPGELGYPPVTEPLVDVAPSLSRLRELALLSADEHNRLWDAARRIHFKDRTDEAIFAEAAPHALAAYRQHRIGQKAQDALELIVALKACPDSRSTPTELAGPTSLFATTVLPELVRQREKG